MAFQAIGAHPPPSSCHISKTSASSIIPTGNGRRQRGSVPIWAEATPVSRKRKASPQTPSGSGQSRSATPDSNKHTGGQSSTASSHRLGEARSATESVVGMLERSAERELLELEFLNARKGEGDAPNESRVDGSLWLVDGVEEWEGIDAKPRETATDAVEFEIGVGGAVRAGVEALGDGVVHTSTQAEVPAVSDAAVILSGDWWRSARETLRDMPLRYWTVANMSLAFMLCNMDKVSRGSVAQQSAAKQHAAWVNPLPTLLQVLGAQSS